jgi:hypothetical protein
MPPTNGDKRRTSSPGLAVTAAKAGLQPHQPGTARRRLRRGTTGHVDAEGRRWRCEVGFVEVDGRFEPVSFTVSSADELNGEAVPVDDRFRPVTTALVRTLPVATIEQRARENLVRQSAVRLAAEHALAGTGKPLTGTTRLDEARRDYIAVLHGATTRERPESLHHRLVAFVYTEAWREGDRAPAKAVARYFSEIRGHAVSPSTARNWIRRARQLNLLPATKPRKAQA